MKKNLVAAYGAKRMSGKSPACSACSMADGGKCMAHGGMAKMAEGGMVDAQKPLHTKPSGSNPEMEASMSTTSMAPHEMVDEDLPNESDSSMDEQDLPTVAKSMSLAAEIMKDRKRQMMAKGGMVGSDHEPVDAPTMSDMDHDSDEMDAPMEDGRDSRGLNTEPVHTMEDDEHETSDASLVAQILRDRKSRRVK